MSHILVTGGTGELGSDLVPRLVQAGHTVRVMSRRPRLADAPNVVEWAQADLETGVGLKEAISDIEIIVNSASSSGKSPGPARTHEVDVDGTRNFLELAKAQGVKHLIHVSIVGIERIPMGYYNEKVAAEEVVKASGIPYSILRATQFHSLIDGRLQPLRNLLLAPIPVDYKFQTIETGEVAERLKDIVAQPPAGLLPDMGGPEVLTMREMAEAWLKVQNKRCWLLPAPAWDAVANGFNKGYNTCPDHRDGKLMWREWLIRKYA